MVSRTVLLSVTSAQRGAAYVAALEAAGVPRQDIRIVVAGDLPGGPPGGTGTAGSIGSTGSPGYTAAADSPGSHSPLDAGCLAGLFQGAAGLVLGGGADVEPGRYGEEPLAGAGLELWPRRDALEWELLEAAREQRLPVWGVCRGFQVLNVFLGGTLWQDLPAQRPGSVAHDLDQEPDLLAHTIEVLAPGLPLAERLAAAGPRPRVNSRHHQGVKRLAPGLVPIAAAADGLIEAAVLTGDGAAVAPSATGAAAAPSAAGAGNGGPDAHRRLASGWWVRGVAWHPENLIALPEQLALWQDFAAAALGRAASGADR
jgi:putative glutamine amidotransferase